MAGLQPVGFGATRFNTASRQCIVVKKKNPSPKEKAVGKMFDYFCQASNEDSFELGSPLIPDDRLALRGCSSSGDDFHFSGTLRNKVTNYGGTEGNREADIRKRGQGQPVRVSSCLRNEGLRSRGLNIFVHLRS